MATPRIASTQRATKETRIEATLSLDGAGEASIATGVPFFDHLLQLFAHGLFDIQVEAKGDLEFDYHHTVEDVGLVLGGLFREALGDKAGIARYGFFVLPMDECLARVAVDLGNRPVLVYEVKAPAAYVRDFHIGLVKEFCRAFANACGANLHVRLEYGEDPHHIAECLFKCLARALDGAVRLDPRREGAIPSTKGAL